MIKIKWKARSSYLLYFYQYLVLLVIALVLNQYSNLLASLAILAIAVLLIDAKTMRYEVSDSQAFVSGSLLERESYEIDLKDVVDIYVLDEKPWSFFSLGTVLLVIDPHDEAHPCIKAVKNPYEIASKIETLAVKQGAVLG
ncbi:hypothetical protein ACMXYQ_07055 [Neptuniibacter sp. PT34_22]|uniref:hypothetical protein n=1 Tax=Neptuniibacter sp. PT34_22 TaxID=3398205 RepID=UPI0039F599A4